MTDKKTYFFLGIGGIGMSALARYCFLKGLRVGGYDATASDITKELSSLGIFVTYTDSLEGIPALFLDPNEVQLVYTPAVPELSQLFSYFKTSGFSMHKRAAMLGDITRDSFSFAVGGTHGKTTTSTMLAHLLDHAGVGISAFLGGISNNFNSNLWLKDAAVSVIEADEFDRSFLHLSPNMACITGTDADHLDIYETKAALEAAFVDFSKLLKTGGTLFVHESVDSKISGIRYGISKQSDYRLENITYKNAQAIADIHTPNQVLKEVVFPMPGTHNMLNALVAFAMAEQYGVPSAKLLEGLKTFKGVKRRMSFEIHTPDQFYVDDYAHHPTAITALYETLQSLYPNQDISVVFQPHLFSRTRDFMTEFAQSLSLFSRVYLLPIYPARELPIAGVSSEVLLAKIESPKKCLVTLETLVETLRKDQPKHLITLGAGDIGLKVNKIKKVL